MKITKQDFEKLQSLVKPLDTKELRKIYIAGDFPLADRVQDLDKRYRWDLVFATKQSNFINDLYQYLNDEHLDSALRKIVPPLGD